MAFGRRKKGLLRHPAQYVAAAFVGSSLIGACLLMLPWATEPGESTSFITAWFTATSAVCVTGLTVVDTGGHWSTFGEGAILLLIQVGGLGVMTLTSLIVVGVAHRLGLRQRLIAAASTGSLELGEIRSILRGVARVTITVELLVMTALTLRLWLTHGESLGRAAYLGLFHAVSSFNNAGFGLLSDNLMSWQDDPLFLGVIAAAIVMGGLGFPVWVQIGRELRHPSHWDLHAKLTVATTIVLILVGFLTITAFEWSNSATLGPMDTLTSLSNGMFASITPRTAGFNSIDVGAMNEESLLVTEVLMFIGGGSGSTAGGIKVTTFALLAFVIWAELRGEADVVIFRRRIPTLTQRQALTVALMAVGLVVVPTLFMLRVTELPQHDVLFETISALGTVGLSTGVTPILPGIAQLALIALMILGRVGPPTLFAALVLRQQDRLFRHPEERPIIG